MKLVATERLRFLLATVKKEEKHLLLTTSRLFAQKVDAAWVASLETNPDLAERLDAFVARFNRLQDTIGDKLIPELMSNVQGYGVRSIRVTSKFGDYGSSAVGRSCVSTRGFA